ncbi:MAG TPA: Uma2 family endonuclease [Bryobacteraceae bacterium]|nr:Uma2 family endonuclease [Bryobacteraceae bacterium]
MPAGTLVSVEEYLSTSYDPDRDYVDGEVLERNWGEQEHSRLQGVLFAYLFNREKPWGIHVFPEQRLQVTATRFRVPDICVIPGPRPKEQIFTRPPLICIEILSPEDTMTRMQERIEDYLRFGVPHVWVLDPRTKRAYDYTIAGMREAKDILRSGHSEIAVPLAEIFNQ